ncbi:hypothetical protein EOM09_08415 [bacterium]|nr:hypothetical protein [bacterium]
MQWYKVKQLIEKYLSNIKDVEIIIYEPNDEVKKILKEQVNNINTILTPARAMLLYSMFSYESLGEHSSLFVANKFAWFLQRLGENLKLKFDVSHYGPYSIQIIHVLHKLNGKYIKKVIRVNIKDINKSADNINENIFLVVWFKYFAKK